LYIDAKWNEDDNDACLRFINHSCLPNGRFELWNVRGYYRIGFFTNFAVPANTELTANYNMVVHDSSEQVQCLCPLIPPHQFPPIDPTRCHRVLCPSNTALCPIDQEIIDITGPDSPDSALSLSYRLRSSPLRPSPTSQPGRSSVPRSESGSAPRDVGS
jgi:hypothetical protein